MNTQILTMAMSLISSSPETALLEKSFFLNENVNIHEVAGLTDGIYGSWKDFRAATMSLKAFLMEAPSIQEEFLKNDHDLRRIHRASDKNIILEFDDHSSISMKNYDIVITGEEALDFVSLLYPDLGVDSYNIKTVFLNKEYTKILYIDGRLLDIKQQKPGL